MTERQFRELLLSMDDKVRIRKMGTSGDVWVAMGQLVNGATERDLSSHLEAMTFSATVIGENGTVWLKVSDKEEVTDEKPPIVIPPLNIGLFLATLLTTLMAGTLMEGDNPLM